MKVLPSIVNKVNELKTNYFFNGSVNNPEFLIFFRIAIGLFLALHFLAIIGDFQLLYGMDSIIPSDIQTIYLEDHLVYYNEIIGWLNNITNNLSTSIFVFQASYLSLCILVACGFYSRFSAILLLIIQVALIKSAYYYGYGVDFFSSMALMYLILQPGDEYFSIRNLFRSKTNKTDLTPFRRLFQIHICIAYFASGFEKIIGYNWRNGESIWKALHLPNFGNYFDVNFDILGAYPVIFIIIGWMTIVIELCYPLFINLQKTRKIWLGLTVSMHIGIAFFLNLYFFSAMMIIWNLTAYYFDSTTIKLNLSKIDSSTTTSFSPVQ